MRQSDRHGISHVSNESSIFEENFFELETCIRSCLKIISECFDTRKKLYLVELKKNKELSNIAIRNAAQVNFACHTNDVALCCRFMDCNHVREFV